MKRGWLAMLLVVLVLAGFYGAWPAWTGFRIKQAIDRNNTALLDAKVDFPRVREALRPTLIAEVDRQLERLRSDSGRLGSLIASQIRPELRQRIVDAAVSRMVTPENVIRMVREGRSLQQMIESVVAEQAGFGSGERPGVAAQIENVLRRRPPPEKRAPREPTPEEEAVRAQRRLGLKNIKQLSLDGPLTLSIGLARNPEATEPDATARLQFVGTDWRVVALTPRLGR